MKWSELMRYPKDLRKRIMAQDVMDNVDAGRLSAEHLSYYSIHEDDDQCEVCAVGAVLYSKVGKEPNTYRIIDSCYEAMKELGYTHNEAKLFDDVFEGSVEEGETYYDLSYWLSSLDRTQRLRAQWNFVLVNKNGDLKPDAHLKYKEVAAYYKSEEKQS